MKSLILLFVWLYVSNAENTSEEFAKANTHFARSVYEQLAKTKSGNFLVSPFSAETILALTQSGCKDKNAEELITALHLPNDQTKIETTVKSALSELKKASSSIHCANKIYVKNNFSINDQFKSIAQSAYQAEIEQIDFRKNVEAATSINKWVEEHTKNKIKNLIDSSKLDQFTAAILVNALYFNAKWTTPFSEHLTKSKPFHKSETEIVNVDTLQNYRENFDYYECPHLKAQFLELPFEGIDASMTIVLPNEINGLSRLENSLDQVFSPQHKLESTYLNVALPKFKFESSTDFKDILSKLGVKKIFNENEADLSGISGEKGDLFVSQVVQKTCIDVNENGVEAAAASYVQVEYPRSGRIDRPKDFNADHPFIFYIKLKDLILFAGRVVDPSTV